MNMDALRVNTDSIFAECYERFAGIGAEQYYDPVNEVQKFESMTVDEIVTGAREELLDFINYAVMLIIKLDSSKDKG